MPFCQHNRFRWIQIFIFIFLICTVTFIASSSYFSILYYAFRPPVRPPASQPVGRSVGQSLHALCMHKKVISYNGPYNVLCSYIKLIYTCGWCKNTHFAVSQLTFNKYWIWLLSFHNVLLSNFFRYKVEEFKNTLKQSLISSLVWYLT